MAAKPWEHAARARAALHAIVTDPGLGPAVLSSGRLLANVLEDLLPEAPRERAILVMAAQAGLAETLRMHGTHGMESAIAVSLTAASLENASPLDPDACHWVATEMAVALGIAASEDQGQHDRPAADRAEPAQHEPATVVVPDGGQRLRSADPVPPPAALAPITGVATVDAAVGPAAEHSGFAAGSPMSAPETTPLAAAQDSPLQPEQASRRRRRRHTGVTGVAFSPDGRLFATVGGDGTASLREATTGGLVRRLAGHGRKMRSVVFSPDGRFLAIAGTGDATRMWEVASGAPVRMAIHGPTRDVAFSSDGRLLATAGGGSTPVAGVAAAAVTDSAARLWEVATGALVRSLGDASGPADAVAFSPDGQLIATAGGDLSVQLWEVASGQLVRVLGSHATAVAFSPDGRLLATAGAGAETRLWEVASGDSGRTATHGPARDVAFSPDGQLLATAGGGSVPAAGIAAAVVTDRSAWLWEVATGTLVRTLAGHAGQVQTVAFSPDGHVLATCAGDGTARLWSWQSATAIHCLVNGS